MYRELYRNVVTLFCVGVLMHSVGNASTDAFDLTIEKTHTRVSIARINLELDTVRYENGYLRGNYEIKVPLSGKYNDIGTIALGIEDLERMKKYGGILKGLGESKVDGTKFEIICNVTPVSDITGGLELQIFLKSRTLTFKTQYSL